MARPVVVDDLESPISELERECHESIAWKRRVGVAQLTDLEAAALRRAKNIVKTWVQINVSRQHAARKDALESGRFLVMLTEWVYIEADLQFFGLSE